MSAADLAAVLLVVGKVFSRHQPVFITDQPVSLHLRRVEVHLDLHVLRNGDEGSAAFLHQRLARLIDRVDIAAVAVSVVRQGFHLVVLVIAHAESQAGQAHAALALFRHQPGQVALAGHADVQVAVRRQQDTVHAALPVILRRDLICPGNARAAVGGTARFQFADRFHNPGLVCRRSAFQHHPVTAGVSHDGDGILRLKFVQQEQERPLHQVQPVAAVHAAGGIDQEDQVMSGAVVLLHFRRLQADQQQLCLFVPGAGPDLRRHAERFAFLRLRIAVMEVVQHFLDPDAACRDPRPVQYLAPELGI